MDLKYKLFLLITALFSFTIIMDFELLSSWKTVSIKEIYGETINGGRYRRGDYVIKVDIGYNTIVVNPSYAGKLSRMDSLEVYSTPIFRKVTAIGIPVNGRNTYIPMEYGLQNGYYFFPIILLISSLLSLVLKSNKVKAYLLVIAAIVGIFTLSVLIFN